MLIFLLCTVNALTINYNGFTLNFDCANKTALRWSYNLTIDTGTTKRPSSFYKDPNLPSECQQKSTTAYGSGYDRGHLVTSNHMDIDSTTIRQSHYMTNIVPQISTFNQGIWQQTEQITECYRDVKPISIYGGVIYSDPSNDYFLLSHGIRTPEYFWKVLVSINSKNEIISIGWFIPNQENLETLESYIVSISEIESKLDDGLGKILPTVLGLEAKKGKMDDWLLLGDCDNS